METKNALGERIRDWLVEFYPSILYHTDRPGLFWQVEAKDAVGGIDVVQFRAHPDRIIVQTAVGVAESHKAALGEMDAAERKLFICDLQAELLRLDVLFTGLKHPLETVFIQQFAYSEDATRTEVIRMALRVQHVGLLIATLLDRKLDGGSSQEIAGVTPLVH